MTKNAAANPSDHVTKMLGRGRITPRGFSLMELIIVLVVASILAGLLMPAMAKVRENVHRVMCSSNLRQIGIGVAMYAGDNRDRFPHTRMLQSQTTVWKPQELMGARLNGGWDGLGLLFAGDYCNASGCFYCPSHRGEHPFMRYAADWSRPGSSTIYTNYHYGGHLDWETGRQRAYANLDRLILATDGLRTVSDFNHQVGLNALRGDGAVTWREDGMMIMLELPDGQSHGGTSPGYISLWNQLERNTEE